MKVFSAIMAIYILGLMFAPCVDAHAEDNSEEPQIESIDTHENHIDTCSPFCFCDCCQTISQPAIYNYFSHFEILTGTSVHFITAPEFSVPVTLWRPPKI